MTSAHSARRLRSASSALQQSEAARRGLLDPIADRRCGCHAALERVGSGDPGYRPADFTSDDPREKLKALRADTLEQIARLRTLPEEA
ncbi:MAG: hypothetical protein HYV63_29940 [Candidatus Schekmanbacteria bacterium]|nr:hypothetical protein [Candidatus Schekmanbacteria bacterium]